jgi:outer membrane protein OmpA-like peptidoglycan-associated protein/tetratricopeptide (TPR) repeat protein
MKNLYIFSIIICVFTSYTWSQNSDTRKADQHFERFAYADAIKAYEKLIQKGKSNSYVYKQLAKAYYKTSDHENAEQFYKRYLRNTRNAEAEVYYEYAQTLLVNGREEDFKKNMMEFVRKAPRDSRAKAFKENTDYLTDLNSMRPRFELNKLNLNSEYSDFGAYEIGDKLYFVSARNEKQKTYDWDKGHALDVYVAEDVSGTFENPVLVEGDINSKFHEGTLAITKDSTTVYFTRNDYFRGKYRTDENGVNHLKIYKASLVNGTYQDVQDLSINDVSFSNANPALSPDESQLYFSSDRPGGYGDSDIYVVDIQEDGSLGEPRNLGPSINTEGRENFPYIDQEHTLYFSSDGHLGLGGLDVYYSKKESGDFLPPQNLGYPLNSSADDFSFSYNPNTEKGYVASNRVEKRNEERTDHIYAVKLTHPLEQTLISVEVIDAKTEEFMENVQVIFYDKEGEEYSRSETNGNGLSKNYLPTTQEFDIQVNRMGYESESNTLKIPQTQMLYRVALVPEKSEAELAMQVIEKRIFFDYDDASIRPEAALELDKLIVILEENPELNIKVISHTDERGSEDYNLELSKKRAENTVKHLVENGIEASRLTSEGKGKSEPVNECKTECTDEEHEQNRRSEFKIVE